MKSPNSPVSLLLVLLAVFSTMRADTLELQNGSLINGTLSGRNEQFVTIARKEGISEIERRVPISEIARIRFQDTLTPLQDLSSEDPQKRISILELLTRKRISYLDLLSATDEALFVDLLRAYLEGGRANDCLERSKLWKSRLRATLTLHAIEELQIVAALRLEQRDEAAVHARRWIKAGHSAHETAIAWVALAEVALQENDFENALWLALNPIVFTHPSKPRHLAAAYETAVFAAFQLKDTLKAQQLLQDMEERGLEWSASSNKSLILPQIRFSTNDSPQTFSRNKHPQSDHTLYKMTGLP